MSNAAGAVSSLLMSLPLVAVPCLAVFGLPSLGPPTADASTEESIELGSPVESAGKAAVAFAPIVDAGKTPAEPSPFESFETAQSDRRQIEPTSDHRGAAANRAVGLDHSVVPRERVPSPASNDIAISPDVFALADIAPPVTATAATKAAVTAPAAGASSSAGWEETVARLNGHGIREFHLTNGEVPGEFHFSCAIYERGRSVTRRFEAEGASPAEAAEDVLQQVEQWLATRTR
jgi:hypothetical protein